MLPRTAELELASRPIDRLRYAESAAPKDLGAPTEEMLPRPESVVSLWKSVLLVRCLWRMQSLRCRTAVPASGALCLTMTTSQTVTTRLVAVVGAVDQVVVLAAAEAAVDMDLERWEPQPLAAAQLPEPSSTCGCWRLTTTHRARASKI